MTKDSDYCVVKITKTTVWIEDLNLGGRSVTNDAERVCKKLNGSPQSHGRRIIYKDSDGQWGELLHVNGRFTGFGDGEAPT